PFKVVCRLVPGLKVEVACMIGLILVLQVHTLHAKVDNGVVRVKFHAFFREVVRLLSKLICKIVNKSAFKVYFSMHTTLLILYVILQIPALSFAYDHCVAGHILIIHGRGSLLRYTVPWL